MNILNPTTWLYGLLAFVLVGGSGYLYGRTDGRKIERVEWQAIDNAKLKAATDKLAELTAAAIKKERSSADALADVSRQFQEDLKNERNKKERVIADLRAGAVRLRDPNGRCSGIGIAFPEAGSAPGGRDGGAGTELSERTAEYLISEASRADEIVRQLTACQKIVIKDRE